MRSETAKPRVGLITEEVDFGGIVLSAARHARLMADEIEVIPIALADSDDQAHWHGVIEELDDGERRSYRVRAADFKMDRVTGHRHLRHHAFATCLIRIAERERLAAFHVYGAFKLRPLIAAYAAVECALPLILSFRGIDLDARVFCADLTYLRTAAEVARVCVCMNQRAKRRVEGLLRPRGPVFVSHNYVDPGDFANGPAAELPVSGPVIGCVAELRRVMGLDFLLHAFEALAAKRRVALLLVGPMRREEAPYYNAVFDRLRHADRILRVGRVDHARVLSYMKACDVMVFPSVSDASPNKVLEAMLAERAIVAADVGGIPEMIRDGVDGLLVDARDPAAIAAACDSLLDDPDRRRRYGRSARERAGATFNAESARQVCREYYREAGICS